MNTHRVLAIDIGNSATNLALFDGGDIVKYEVFPSKPEFSEDIAHAIESWKSPSGRVIIASVVPDLSDRLLQIVNGRGGARPVMVEEFKTELLPLRVDRPETLGVDRIVISYAALHLIGKPAIVISMGTATTFEVISKEGEYIGGAIAPGVKISLEALTQRAALLPPVDLAKPPDLLAKNTVDHIQSGVYYGAISLIEGMANRFKARLGDSARVIGTGGISGLFAEEGVFDYHEPHLLLKGLELIDRRQK
jgi:type III pantothenate kinase